VKTFNNSPVFISGTRNADGTAANPAYTFASDLDTGIYRSGVNTISLVTGGVNCMVWDSAHNTYAYGAILPDANNTRTLGTANLGWASICLANGSAGSPSVTFASDLDTGIYRIGSNNIGMATNGTKILDGSVTSGVQLKATATNDSAPAGFYGEYVESTAAAWQSTPTNGNYFDAGSLALTAGDWDVTGIIEYTGNTGTWAAAPTALIGISTTTGNSSAGLTDGTTLFRITPFYASSTFSYVTLIVPSMRVSIAGSTTYYLKGQLPSVSGGQPQYAARFSARRVR
jgi:hypothetical protein